MAHTSKRKSMSAGWGRWALMLLTLVIPGIAWAGAGFGPPHDCP